jgi:hypothetical protein
MKELKNKIGVTYFSPLYPHNTAFFFYLLLDFIHIPMNENAPFVRRHIIPAIYIFFVINMRVILSK